MGSPRSLMRILNQLEANSAVHFRYRGLDCWPIVRNTFTTVPVKSGQARSGRPGFRDIMMSLRDLAFLLLPGKKVDALILTDFKYHVIHGDEEFLRDGSAVSRTLEENGYSSLLLTQGFGSRNTGIAYRTVYALIAVSYVIAGLLANFKYRSPVRRYVDEIFSRVGEGDLKELNANRATCVRNIYFVVIASWLFRRILRRLSPERCFIVCYYSVLGMALCSACRSESIESLDIQHGVGGRNMRSYGQWVNVPREGYNTLPSVFLCWTRIDKDAIDRWAHETCGVHRAVVSGNLWYRYLDKVGRDGHFPEFLDRAIRGRMRVVVYTAKSTEISPAMEVVIQNAPDMEVYIARLHPDTPESEIECARHRYSGLGERFVMLSARSCGIRDLMTRADVHITEWSASVYDALFEGVPSIVISEIGAEYFEEFVEQRFVKKAFKSGDIRAALDRLFEQSPRVSNSLYGDAEPLEVLIGEGAGVETNV